MWRNDNRKRRSSLDFDFFSFRFCDRSRVPRAAYAFIRCPRSIRGLRVVSPFDFSVWCGRRRRPDPLGFPISPRFTRAFQSSLSRIRFHRMTIAQRTTLSNQLRLCRIPKHPRCRRRLQRHVRSKRSNLPPLRQLTVAFRHGRNLDGHRLSIQVCELSPIAPYTYNLQLT